MEGQKALKEDLGKLFGTKQGFGNLRDFLLSTLVTS
jgi:hypothetical protein